MRSLLPTHRVGLVRFGASFALVALLACSSDEGGIDPPPGADPDAAPAVEPTFTWHRDVAPLLHERCVTCHVDGGIGPFPLVSYDDAAPVSGLISYMTAKREMPPWSAEESGDCAPRHGWVDDPRLSDEQIDMLRVWAQEGAPEGDPDDAAPLPPPRDRELVGVTHTLAPEQPYATSGYADELVCVLLDPKLVSPHWLTGLEIVPGNLEVVHHVVLSAVPPDVRPEIEARVGPDGTFECFGGIGVAGVYPLGVWVPGSDPFETPAGVGIPIQAGSAILMQMHYHPRGDAQADATTAKMRLTASFPGKSFLFIGFGNAYAPPILQPGPNDRAGVEFRVPANVDDHTETMVYEVQAQTEQRFPMFFAFPHMHYVGRTLKVTIDRPSPAPDEPASECLINVNRWSFDWQRTYQYDAPIDQLPTIGNGDVVHLECGYDNTKANPFVVRALDEQGLEDPVDVYLGEQTLDEMCIAAFGVIF